MGSLRLGHGVRAVTTVDTMGTVADVAVPEASAACCYGRLECSLKHSACVLEFELVVIEALNLCFCTPMKR